MRFEHPDHPGRGVRLGYCTNLVGAEDLDGVLEGLRTYVVGLRSRLGWERGPLGVGPWLPAHLALELTAEQGGSQLDRLVEFFAEHDLDPFTFNAFPWGGFHRPGLKAGVFRPTWRAPERMAYTLAVARIALALREALGGGAKGGHLSISTHAGALAADIGPGDLDEIAENLVLVALNLSQLEDETGTRVVLGLEPEPRSTANDTRELTGLFERILLRSHEVLGRGHASLRQVSEDIVRAHLGTCLDACHAAVEFEAPPEAYERATLAGTPLGKLQFSSALALAAPDAHPEARGHLFALDEPVFLHQVTGRRGEVHPRCDDLPDLARAWAEGDPAWRNCDEWRCHFHVPVDLEAPAALDGLRTTRAEADALLELALCAPERWGSAELHLEVETYTWDVLDPSLRGPEVVDGIERELRHVLARLAAGGWRPADR